jgi:N-acyl-D-aspartate/D-glutamate deacylase
MLDEVIPDDPIAQIVDQQTSRTAAIFGLSDRGRIAADASADLVLVDVLVDGDPFKTITATLNTRTVWRRGHRIRPNA